MPTPAASDNVRFGLIDETIEGTLETGTPLQIALTTGITPEYTSETISDPTIDGGGEAIDAKTTLRGLNLTTPAIIRFGDNIILLAPALRDLQAVAAAVTATADATMLTAGTHLAGSSPATGPQIKIVGSTTALDDFIDYAGSTDPKGGAEKLLMRNTGWVNAENNRHRRIKAVWKDATDSFIDIEPGYVGGTVGFFGEPVVAEVGSSPTINIGRTLRNRNVGAGVVSKTALWQYLDMSTFAKFASGFGLVAGDVTVAWTGKAGATLNIPWSGYGSNAVAAADPTGSGFAADGNLYSQMMDSADLLQHFALVTATTPIVMSQLNMNSFTVTVAGNIEPITDVSGTSRVTGVRRGRHVATGEIGWYHVDNAVTELIAQLGDESTAEKSNLDWMFRDRDGNEIAMAILAAEWTPTGSVPGAENSNVEGSLSFTGHRSTDTSRSFVEQEIAA